MKKRRYSKVHRKEGFFLKKKTLTKHSDANICWALVLLDPTLIT